MDLSKNVSFALAYTAHGDRERDNTKPLCLKWKSPSDPHHFLDMLEIIAACTETIITVLVGDTITATTLKQPIIAACSSEEQQWLTTVKQ